jgi:hypothetical protein
VEGNTQDFLGVNVNCHQDQLITFLQPHLINKIIKATKLDSDEVGTKDAPMASSHNLNQHLDSNSCGSVFHC